MTARDSRKHLISSRRFNKWLLDLNPNLNKVMIIGRIPSLSPKTHIGRITPAASGKLVVIRRAFRNLNIYV